MTSEVSVMVVIRASFFAACAAVLMLGTLGCGGGGGELPGKDGGPGTDGAPLVDGSPTVDVVVPVRDAQPPPIDAPIGPEGGYCLPDLVACISSAQCCSGYCDGNKECAPGGPPPACTPDGYACQSSALCCSGSCFNGVCGATIPDSGSCTPYGYACNGGTNCCTGFCLNGICDYLDTGVVCRPDGNYCQSYTDCCSGICANGTCGYGVYDSGPVCSPDGYACQTYSQCCSGVCSFGVCGTPYVDASPPPACYAPVPRTCDYCLASACCPQLGACESDPLCSQDLSCFDSCYVQGSGTAAACAQKCQQAYPSPLGTTLFQCGTNCLPSCN